MIFEYLNILIFIIIATLLSFIIFFLNYFLILREYDIEKVSAYECGFEPFEDSRNAFDVRFYLVAILFIIFDLEIAFLFPWSSIVNLLSSFGFWAMIYFLLILTVGFIYEWQKGALDW